MLHAESDSEAEPSDVDVDEQHRSCEFRDLVGDPVLHACRSLFCVFQENWIRLRRREVRYALEKDRLFHRQTAPLRKILVCRPCGQLAEERADGASHGLR
jgi:hypothetical protein